MSPSLAWIILIIAGLFEVIWAVGLKYTQGFSRLVPSLLTISAMIISMYLLGRATHILPISTAYAIWVGIGVIGASTLGILLFHEPLNFWKIFFLLTLVASIIGLKLSSQA